MPLGALISAGASLLGGALSSSSSSDAQARAQRQASKANRRNLRLAAKDRAYQQKLYKQEAGRQDKWAQQNIDLQKQFAQEGLRWKVEDAKAAGIHPLYALGANTTSFSPVSVGGVSSGGGYGAAGTVSPPVFQDNSIGSSLAAAGQDIGNAVSAMATPQERLSNFYALENMGLQNDLLRAQIASTVSNRTGRGPGMPAATGPTTMFGQPVQHSQRWTGAQEGADRYGEPYEWLAFPFILGSDLRKTFIAEFGQTPESIITNPKPLGGQLWDSK